MGAWGVYPFLPSGKILLSDMQTGLYIFDVDYNNAIISNVELNKNRSTIFPNPATNNITVTNSHQSITNIQIIDASGRCVYQTSQVDNYHHIDLSSFSKGLYFVKTDLEIVKLFLQ